MKTIEDLARHVNALNLAPGQEYRIDVPTYDQLAFNSNKYEMRFQELDTKLAAGLVAVPDVSSGVHHVVPGAFRQTAKRPTSVSKQTFVPARSERRDFAESGREL